MESSVPPATTDIPLDSDKASENFSVSFYFIWFTFISLSFGTFKSNTFCFQVFI